MKLEDFFNRIQNNNTDEYLYFSTNFKDLPISLKSDLLPIDNLIIDIGSHLDPSLMLWMGAKGVTAHTHYDSMHNMFVQIYGVSDINVF